MKKDIRKYQDGGIIDDFGNPVVDSLANNQLDTIGIQPTQAVDANQWAKLNAKGISAGDSAQVKSNNPWADLNAKGIKPEDQPNNELNTKAAMDYSKAQIDYSEAEAKYGDLRSPQRVKDLTNLTSLNVTGVNWDKIDLS